MEQTSPLSNTTVPPQITTTPSVNPPPPKKSFLIIFLAVLVIILVSLNAYLFLKLQNQPKVPVASPAPVVRASPTPTPDPTANWKTFQSTHFAYLLFKYPDDVKVNLGTINDQQTVNIAYAGKYQKNNMAWVDGITIDITYNLIPAQNNLVNLIDERIKKFPNTFQPMKTIKINTISGFQLDHLGEGVTDIYLPHNNGAYLLISIAVMDSHNLGYQKIADQILSTFKFLE